ncbi:hypothetical protein HBO38_33850 [Pseudomonas veronii]|uniref:Lipoprotein n=1 Tax=Pseudomonas veronii TaxID=76761 RepID=A0A7Y1ACP2_PSEVE|nr:hypothetical protein [Pseudomonas veronii]NMY13323.1 hypothetical protein [Pseudomonas veronii]
MKTITKLLVAASISAVLAGCGGDDSPVVKSKTIDDVGRFIEKSDQLTPQQKKDLSAAVPNLMNEWVIKHGFNEDIKKDLGAYFDGMHVNEIIKKGGTELDRDKKAEAEGIAINYRAKRI